MPHIIQLDVGSGLTEEQLLEALRPYANDELLPLLPNLENICPRAELDDGSVELESVTKLTGHTYNLEFRFTWSAYIGCRDWNKSGELEERHSHFTYSGSTARFEWIEEPERYPNDEL
jgi:hypothetical protein